MDALDLGPFVEARFRRPQWTQGLPVLLADGLPWYLPRVDLAVLVTNPGLRDLLDESSRIADRAGSRPGDRPAGGTEVSSPRGGMVAVAFVLLHLNYDLPTPRLARLVAFDDPTAALDCADRTARVVSYVDHVLTPRLGATGPGAAPAVWLN